jgi:hypothetical protein
LKAHTKDDCMLILIGLVFFGVASAWVFKSCKKISQKDMAIISFVIAEFIVGLLCIAMPFNQYIKKLDECLGLPINGTAFLGHRFVPQAFVVTEKQTLLYDKDGKVYSLNGIRMDKDLNAETLTVGTNMYTIYLKGDELYFGSL